MYFGTNLLNKVFGFEEHETHQVLTGSAKRQIEVRFF
jgi:hypothetical protein